MARIEADHKWQSPYSFDTEETKRNNEMKEILGWFIDHRINACLNYL